MSLDSMGGTYVHLHKEPEHAKKAIMDTLLAVTLFLIVMKAASLYNGKHVDIDYHRVVVFTALFMSLTYVLRITKSSMSHVLVHAMYLKLGSVFAKEFVGHVKT